MACDEVIYVVPVGNRLVPASHPMTVFLIVRIAGVIRSAGGRIPAAYVQSMVVHMVLVGPMQMTFVQIVHVLVVFNRGMAATGLVRVGMPFMSLVISRHNSPCLAASFLRCMVDDCSLA